jgi:flagellar biosynthesis GTPase FlhF
MLRAFNGECDSFIARVNYRNVEAMKRRIKSSYDQINKLAESWPCSLSGAYLRNRISELELVYEYEEEKQQQKQEQARIREQMREEEKAAKEAEWAKDQAEREEQQYQDLLERVQAEAAEASESEREGLNTKIQDLQKRIAEVEDKKRAISQAMLTRVGHVYIISNVGSFGENIYKIGMTRSLEPMDRVKELGDASVPFPFDVHALITTSDAPSLENALHKHFNHRRLNLENERKEFFHVTIEEIRDELEKLK